MRGGACPSPILFPFMSLQSFINNAGIPVGLISFNAYATVNQIGVTD
jgi:hypothetical protein